MTTLSAEQETQLTEAKTSLNKAKIQLMTKPDSAFFTTLAFSFRYIWDWTIPTACTDGIVIRINPAFWMSLDAEERLFLLLHEVLHCAYMHMLRLGARCSDRWNIACDHVINLQLIARGYKMPAMGHADQQFENMSAEEVYKMLPDNPGQPMMRDLQPGDGDPGKIEQIQKDIEDILVRARIQSKMAGDKPGTIPGEIEIFLNKLLNPKLPWQRILQKYLQSFAKNDYTFKKPNRRFFPKHILPSLYSHALIDLAIFVDASGSVTDEDFLRFVTETHSLLRMMKPAKMTLGVFDTAIKSVDEISSVLELMRIKFTGRGGTSIFPVLEWAQENKPQLLLIFSDGEFNLPEEWRGKTELLWLIHNSPDWTSPFGKVIHYDMEN